MVDNPVVTVNDEERSRVFAALACSFSADPLMRWMFPEASVYLNSAMGEFYDAFGGGAIDLGTAVRTPSYEGAALWYPPGSGPDEERLFTAMQTTVRPEIHEDCTEMLAGMDQYHPKEPCWYLAVIGVDHGHQGCGWGAQLMKHGLAMVDAHGMPAYLESSNPRNMSLYKRHGFEEMGAIQAGTSPTIVPMIRAARPA